MDDSRLDQLLSLAAGDEPSTGDPEIATQVRQRIRRRRIHRISTAAAFAIILISALLIHRAPPRNIAEQTDLDSLRSRCNQLNAEAKMHEQMAERLERTSDSTTAPSIPNVADIQLRAEDSSMAAVLIADAERIAHNPEMTNVAINEYRQVIRAFADTPQAAVAANRLKQLGV